MVVRHSNGYTAKLYGKRSLVIFNPDGKEVLHTGFRNVSTKKETMKLLESMPDFMKALHEMGKNNKESEENK